MLKVYLAAPYQNKDYVNECAAELRALGIAVTSTWLDEPHKPSIQMNELSPEMHRAYARRDVADVVAADVFVLFTDPTGKIVRQGRTAELGIAIAIDTLVRPMPIYIVGMEFENIFHHLAEVEHFATWDAVKDALVSTPSRS